MRRAAALSLLIAVLLGIGAPAPAQPLWKRRIERLAARHRIGIAIEQDGRFLLSHRAGKRRVPASNQKLLTSMALLDTLGRAETFPTIAAAGRFESGVVRGDLWILGRGDPAVASKGQFARSLPFPATGIRKLARRIAGAGITRVRGRVMGSKGYFRHDWDAPGWRSYYQSLYVALPSALTFKGNTHRGRHILDPERLLARALTRRLRGLGVTVGHRAGSGYAPRAAAPLARLESQPLSRLLRHMNRTSSNFFAEVLGKRLAVARFGAPGSIANAGRAIQRWAAARDLRVVAKDASGLSYRDRISARGLVRLLVRSESRPWGHAFKRSLAAAGQGTLKERLGGVRLRAKTGTLIEVSALAGWVWRRRHGSWATFALLSRGMPKAEAAALEDRIVRIVARSGPRPALRARVVGATHHPLA
ncbi:MAG: D-alanyl-D-alanine carboxypeptidase/D-alanyl-D-alanine-endopeptidase [Actinomycetota bacterium]